MTDKERFEKRDFYSDEKNYKFYKKYIEELNYFDEEVYKAFVENSFTTNDDLIWLTLKDKRVIPIIFDLKKEHIDLKLVKSILSSVNVSLNMIDDLLNRDYLQLRTLIEIAKYLDSKKGLLYELSMNDLIKKIIEKLINHPNGGKEILKTLANNSEQFQISYASLIIQNKLCDAEVLKSFTSTDKAVVALLLQNEKFTTDVMLHILRKWKRNYSRLDPEVSTLFVKNDNCSEKCLLILLDMTKMNIAALYTIDEELLISILNNKNCTDKVLDKVLERRITQKIMKQVCYNNKYDKKTRLKLMTAADSLTVEDMKYFVSLNPSKEEFFSLLKNGRLFNETHMINIVTNYVKEINGDLVTVNFIAFLIKQELVNGNIDVRITSKKQANKIITEVKDEEVLASIIDRIYPVISELGFYNIFYDYLEKIVKHPLAGERVKLVLAGKLKDLRFTLQKDEATSRVLELEKVYTKGIMYIDDRIRKERFVIEEEENVTEILRQNVEDGLSTMLWGPSGVGKTARVFEVDPTATMLILKDGMLPEEVIGGKEPNGEPGEEYPPFWYVSLCEKCENEPNRNHILFIDEFTNVSNIVKNLVWEVIGARRVNGKEKWTLPENAVIVVAGNRKEESTAVRSDIKGSVMPAPLHNRIDSMIEIKFDLNEWQKWALEPDLNTGKNKIHPIVYSFCAGHASDVMFTNFNEEDITSPFLTPRKWETLSKAIYKAYERGENHHISDARLKSIIGDGPVMKAFKEHYERIPLDIEKIKDGSYEPSDFPSIDDKLYALSMIILDATLEVAEVESFICDTLESEEYLEVYKTMKNIKNATIIK